MCFSWSSAKEIQRERDGRASGRLQVSRLNSLLKSADQIQSCTAPNLKFTKNMAECQWIDQRTPKGLDVFC